MRCVIATIAAVILLVVIAGTVFVYSGGYDVGADRPHSSVTSWIIGHVRDRSIQAHASGIAVPAGLDNPDKIAAGASHFNEHCAACHGAPGAERGDFAKGLYPRPPDLDDVIGSYTPSELFWILKHGVKMTAMPSWAHHSDDELWAIVAFLEKLPGMADKDYAKLVAAGRERTGSH